MSSDCGPAFFCGDIALERNNFRDRLDWREINCDNKGVYGHAFRSNLGPGTWCSAEIKDYFALFKEIVFLVKLNQFERGTSTVAFLFGELVPIKILVS